MTKRRLIYVAALLILTLAAYGARRWLTAPATLAPEDRALIAKSCAGESLGASHPLLASDAVDKRVAERYGAACRSLALDPHLHFGIGLDAYQCRIWIPRDTTSAADAQQANLIATLFGHRDFDLMAYPRKAGTEATVLLVTDDGEDVAAISDQASLRAALAEVRDLQGAAELVALFNDTGRLAAPPSLCNLDVAADDKGWTLNDVKVPENCAAPWWRSYRVERSGAVNILSSNKRWWRFDSAICSD
ncbi:MAG TPA: hypothetical protein VM659_27345 [Dongiaceae bacterium]|nr:hypothetical protein [Dongiaceae bacterium]